MFIYTYLVYIYIAHEMGILNIRGPDARKCVGFRPRMWTGRAYLVFIPFWQRVSMTISVAPDQIGVLGIPTPVGFNLGCVISSWPLRGNEGMNPQYTNVKVDSLIPY